MRIFLAVLAAVLAAFIFPVRAAIVEETLQVPVRVLDFRGAEVVQPITVTVWRDDQAPGPQPVAVLQHGRPAHPIDRERMGRVRYASHAQSLVRQGFVVVVPTRVGYGVSGGPDVEASGSCSFKNYGPGLQAAAQQTLAVLAAVRERPEADPSRGVVMGQSFGGAAAIALAAMHPPGVQAVVNFSGGAGGNPIDHPQQPCRPSALSRAFAAYGERTRIPALWLYADNDPFFGSSHPRAWFEAYRTVGGLGEFQVMPTGGHDGHSLFGQAQRLWQASVDAFLATVGLGLPGEGAGAVVAAARAW